MRTWKDVISAAIGAIFLVGLTAVAAFFLPAAAQPLDCVWQHDQSEQVCYYLSEGQHAPVGKWLGVGRP